MLRARKYVENVYYHELARDLKQWGYRSDNHPRGDFEIQGFPRNCATGFPNGIGKSMRRPASCWHKIRNWLVGTWPVSARTWLRRTERGKSRSSTGNAPGTLGGPGFQNEEAAISALKMVRRSSRMSQSGRCTGRRHLGGGTPVRPSVGCSGARAMAARLGARARSKHHAHGYPTSHARSGLHPQRPWPISNHDPGGVGTEWDIVCLARDGSGRFRPFRNHFSSSKLLLTRTSGGRLSISWHRAISSRCFAAVRAPERALRCGR